MEQHDTEHGYPRADTDLAPASRLDAEGPDLATEPGSAQAADEAISRLTGMVASLQQDFDSFLPHLLQAIKRNEAFDELSERLREAEESVAVRLNWALVDGAHRLLNDARRLDGLDENVREHFKEQLVAMLRAAGVREFGKRGEEFDPARHEPLEASGEGTRFRVRAVRASGLERAGVVLKRAKVTIERSSAEEPPRQGAEGNGEWQGCRN